MATAGPIPRFLAFSENYMFKRTSIAVFVFTVMAVTSTSQIEPLEEWME